MPFSPKISSKTDRIPKFRLASRRSPENFVQIFLQLRLCRCKIRPRIHITIGITAGVILAGVCICCESAATWCVNVVVDALHIRSIIGIGIRCRCRSSLKFHWHRAPHCSVCDIATRGSIRLLMLRLLRRQRWLRTSLIPNENQDFGAKQNSI